MNLHETLLSGTSFGSASGKDARLNKHFFSEKQVFQSTGLTVLKKRFKKLTLIFQAERIEQSYGNLTRVILPKSFL